MKARTYDILNAGPRNRFMVDGSIVSNSGKGPQFQNLPRGHFKDIDACIEVTVEHGFDFVEPLWGDLLGAASTSLRGMLIASPGHEFISADFSSIEARVGAWLAGERVVLDAFTKKLDLYKVAASQIFNIPYEEVTKSQRQTGKTSELALQYQGGIGAYSAMARNYGIDLETLPEFVIPLAAEEVLENAHKNAGTYLKRNKGVMSHEAAVACDIIKQLWRQKRPNITAMWKGLESASLLAVKNPGHAYKYRCITYKSDEQFLRCKLPSGRYLHYYKPTVQVKETPWGEAKEVVAFYAVDSVTRNFVMSHIYGGHNFENVDQAVSRDFMAEAMIRCENAGYPIVLSVHDELLSDTPIGHGTVEEFEALMCELPKWGKGYFSNGVWWDVPCPITAEGWRSRRYRK